METLGVRTPYYQVFVDGNELSELLYNKIEKIVFKEPESGEQYFVIYFKDDVFEIQESEKFKLEKTACELWMGYLDDYDFIMDGIVSGIAPNYPRSDVPTLEITIKNISSVMNRAEKNVRYVAKTYSDVAIEIAKRYGLTYDVDSTLTIFDPNAERLKNPKAEPMCIYQTGESDYAFLKALAKKIGYKFYIDKNVLYFKKGIIKDAVMLEYRIGGCNLLEFKPNITTTNTKNTYSSADVDFNANVTSAVGAETGATAEDNKAVAQRTYTVVKGDYLIKIAKQFYGDGSKYKQIYDANTDKIKMPNYVIYPGSVLIIP